MLHKTRGIVLHTTDFSETSVVAKIYTELFGLQSYLVNSVRKKKARVKQNLFHPLSTVEMVVYHKERGGLQRIADIRSYPVLKSIPYEVHKSSIALFLNEILYKSIREEEPNESLFQFLLQSILWLDVHDPPNPDFHLLFLLEFSRHLGFFPSDNYSEQSLYFNLQEGRFESSSPSHPFFLKEDQGKILIRLLSLLPDFSATAGLQQAARIEMIDSLIEYYRLHISGFGEIRSHKVLHQIWS